MVLSVRKYIKSNYLNLTSQSWKRPSIVLTDDVIAISWFACVCGGDDADSRTRARSRPEAGRYNPACRSGICKMLATHCFNHALHLNEAQLVVHCTVPTPRATRASGCRAVDALSVNLFYNNTGGILFTFRNLQSGWKSTHTIQISR